MNLKRFFLALCALFISITAQAQLANFTVTATKMNDETCPSNGAISWTTSGTTDGSTLTYSIINTATNASVPTSSTSFSGLVAGSYKIVATQTLGSQSNQASSEVIYINNLKTPLQYSASVTSDEICGNDGEINVSVSSGKYPFTYQLLDTNLNVITSQTTNVFKGLSAGTYNVRVVDQCGAGTAKQYTVVKKQTMGAVSLNRASVVDCDNLSVSLGVTQMSGYTIAWPLSVEISYINPNTGLEEKKYTQAVQTGNGNVDAVNIPFFKNISTLPITAKATDRCGVTRTTNMELDLRFDIRVATTASQCSSFVEFTNAYYKIDRDFTVNFTSYPVGFDPAAYEQYGITPSTLYWTHKYGNASQTLPIGNYSVEFTSQCGEKITKNFTIKAATPNLILANLPNCDDGNSSQVLGHFNEGGIKLSSVKIVSAPAAFTNNNPLPYIIPSDALYGGSQGFLLKDLPVGDYKFEYITTCRPEVYTSSINVAPTVSTLASNVTINCSNVKVDISGTLTPSGSYTMGGSPSYYLEKFNSAKNNWENYASIGDSYYLYQTTFNQVPNGKYRVVARHNIYSGIVNDALQRSYCTRVLKEFDITPDVLFENAYAFQCADGTYDVAISAKKGTETLTYSIVSDQTSGATTSFNNGTNPIFHGLAGGSYYFRVMDNCGNFITRKLELAQLGKPGASVVADCTTKSLKMVVNGVDYLKFAWTKTKNADGTPTNNSTVLSTSNVLDLGTYEATEAGTYSVRMYTDPALGYCIDSSYEMSLTPDALTTAQAGTGKTVNINYDGQTSTLNLFDYLEGPYDGFGTWTETTTPSSSLLTGSKWNVKAASPGTYTFQYSVLPPCGGSAVTTTVTINLAKLCYKLPVLNTEGAGEPTKFGISSLGRAGEAAKGSWPMVRKGGWVALESNTKGFVVNRVAFNADGTPVGIPAANFVAGMMVFDTTNKCLKIYNGTIWSCFTTQTCPE